MDQLDRQAYLEKELQFVSYRCQLAFSAAVAERLLPLAKTTLDAWRRVAWPVHRSALNEIWNFLDGRQLSFEEYKEIRQSCDDQLPNDEDPNWPGGYGGFEAGAAVTYALDVLIDSNSVDSARAGMQPLNVLREYLIDTMFPRAETHHDLDEDAIDNSTLFKREIEIQDRQLSMLKSADSDDRKFDEMVKRIRSESIEDYIILE